MIVLLATVAVIVGVRVAGFEREAVVIDALGLLLLDIVFSSPDFGMTDHVGAASSIIMPVSFLLLLWASLRRPGPGRRRRLSRERQPLLGWTGVSLPATVGISLDEPLAGQPHWLAAATGVVLLELSRAGLRRSVLLPLVVALAATHDPNLLAWALGTDPPSAGLRPSDDLVTLLAGGVRTVLFPFGTALVLLRPCRRIDRTVTVGVVLLAVLLPGLLLLAQPQWLRDNDFPSPGTTYVLAGLSLVWLSFIRSWQGAAIVVGTLVLSAAVYNAAPDGPSPDSPGGIGWFVPLTILWLWTGSLSSQASSTPRSVASTVTTLPLSVAANLARFLDWFAVRRLVTTPLKWIGRGESQRTAVWTLMLLAIAAALRLFGEWL